MVRKIDVWVERVGKKSGDVIMVWGMVLGMGDGIMEMLRNEVVSLR